MNRNDRNEHFQNVSSVYMIIEKEIQSLKCFTIDEETNLMYIRFIAVWRIFPK